MQIYLQIVVAMRLPVSLSAEEVVAMLPVMNSAGVANFVKDIVKPSNLKKGFLRWGFLNLSSAMEVSTYHTSLLESVMSSSTLHVKEDGVVGIPSPLSGCVTPTIVKGDDFRVNGLS